MKSSFQSQQSLPTEEVIIEKYINLLIEKETRENISNWAEYWIKNDFDHNKNLKIWDALIFLSGVDLISVDRPYLHSCVDFIENLFNYVGLYHEVKIEYTEGSFNKIYNCIINYENLNLIKINNKLNINNLIFVEHKLMNKRILFLFI